MERSEQIALMQRALAHLEAGTTEMGEAPTAWPVERYTSAERFTAERSRILRRFPAVVAHASEIAAPGRFVTSDLAGVPVLVSHGHDGVLRAFVNACRHRGTKLVSDAAGEAARSFTCPYHAWTYAEDGRLIGIPGREGFTGAGMEMSGLVPLPVAEAHGWVWVLPKPGADTDLSEAVAAHLGPVAAHLDDYVGPDDVVFASSSRVWKANWKLILEGGLEAYHVQVAHKDTIASLFAPNAMLLDTFGRHLRVMMVKRSLAALAGTDPETWPFREHLNAVHYVFPTSLLLVNPDHTVLFTTRPTAPDATAIDARMVIPRAPTTPSQSRHWQANWDYTMQALDEDFTLAERIQETARSGANRDVTFGRQELALDAVNRAIEGAL